MLLPFLLRNFMFLNAQTNVSDCKFFITVPLFQGIQFGQSLVVDFSSLRWMHSAERRSINYNIRRLAMLNGKSRRPFHLHFTRFFENGTVHYLADKLRFLPMHCALTATANCYSQMFAR